ncbi:hypothetical protein FDP41_013219 [Naegleria fowleri]|uniref:Uncharacterized protein n=1 Tax=Naegleria fowleri TaxID=5763 RepID=A0A6A5BZA2_NAEFO|nr:uncharacterized protein FDP41_013219 [Naegleria fowleri]KAF0980736.1 hypothetical protein FDP41_013219 [Naegleria fowleri]CAG4707781.1 unnamed protein product [Naegleria fowleri]
MNDNQNNNSQQQHQPSATHLMTQYDYANGSNPDVLQRIDAGAGRFRYALYYFAKRPLAAIGFYACAGSFFSMVASLITGQNARTVKFWSTSFILSAGLGLLSIQYYANNPPTYKNYGDEVLQKGVKKYTDIMKKKPKWEQN